MKWTLDLSAGSQRKFVVFSSRRRANHRRGRHQFQRNRHILLRLPRRILAAGPSATAPPLVDLARTPYVDAMIGVRYRGRRFHINCPILLKEPAHDRPVYL